MAQPTLPHQERTGLRVYIDKAALVLGDVIAQRRSRHHIGESWILETDCASAFRYRDIKRSGKYAARMDMAGMVSALTQNIDPERIQTDLAALYFPAKFFCE